MQDLMKGFQNTLLFLVCPFVPERNPFFYAINIFFVTIACINENVIFDQFKH